MNQQLESILPSDAARYAGAEINDRHARKCSVCTHPQRDEIEQDFLHWQSPEKIALAYGIPHHSMIYRHAHALGLFGMRTGLTRHALESIIEQSETCRVTAGSVIRAIRAYSCLTDDGRWIDPPKQVVLSRAAQPPADQKNLIENAVCASRTPSRDSAIRPARRGGICANPLKTKGDENS